MFTPFSLNIRGRLFEYDKPAVMGIVNVTPDSFFAGSRSSTIPEIAKRVEEMITAGADMLDLGAYSSRPGASDVSEEKECRRIALGMKVIRDISQDIPVSVDTFRAGVAREAVVNLGADIVNDISGGDLDQEMWATVADLNAPYILMHMRGNPSTMQALTEYHDVTADVISDLSEKLRRLRLMGVSDIIIDPGFGFSKTAEQNFEMMRNLQLFKSSLGAPVLVGVSRKSMITKSLGITPMEALPGTIALDTIALTRGASILRVHDVSEAVAAVRMYELSTL
ncbi:dihydropteroate synthase [uncultured Duncaniella sp.]|nr:dihydropteroate synthase [uncultured Duncaniella sp.]